MWKLRVMVISLMIYTAVAENKSTGFDNGYLGNCNIEILDLTITKQSTDSLKLLLATGNQNDVYHVYNISRAASLLKDPFFRNDFRTVIFFHGYNDKARGHTSELIADAYRHRGRHNVLMLDASSVTSYEYLRASRITRYVGVRLGQVLAQLSKSGFLFQNLDLVGFGLGAHTAGFTGKSFKKATGKLLPRIIGLDPTGPCFRKASADDRLDKTDAEFVQVLHTNGGETGLFTAIGHADFYINGGRRQKSEFGLFCLALCSHERAASIWTATVEFTEAFVGWKCTGPEEIRKKQCPYSKKKKRAVMGPSANPKIQGVFIVDTASRYPFFYENEPQPHQERRKSKC